MSARSNQPQSARPRARRTIPSPVVDSTDSLAFEISDLPSPNDVGVSTEHDVGRLLRQERRSKQLTLAQVAKLANVSTSYVSQVERGIANPTLASLKTLSNAVGLSIGSLLDGSSASPVSPAANGGGAATEVSVLRAGKRRRVVYPGSHIANELLSPNLRVQMEVIWVEAPPGSGSGGHPHQHEGEECGIVLEGLMRFWVNGREWLLEKRDSIYFPSALPHRWESAGDVDLLAIWIITPPTF